MSEESTEGQSDLDILDSETPPDTETGETEVLPEDEESETDDEIETEDEPEKEVEEKEEEEDEAFQGRFAPKELKKEFPEIFKKFPGLRGIIAQENEYAKVFPTVEEARNAGRTVQQIEKFGASLVMGNAQPLISELSNMRGNALETFSKNFLPTLCEADPVLFTKVTIPFVNNVLRTAQQQARTSGDANLYKAAQYISRFLHGEIEVPDDVRADPKIDAEKRNLEQQKSQFYQKQYNDFKNDTYQSTYDTLMMNISKGFDPENVLTEKAKNAAAQDVFEQIDSVISKDERFMSVLRSYWKEAEQTGLRREASAKIRSAYLARVKPLLSSVRQKVLLDYLPKNSKRPNGNGKKFIPSSGSEGMNKSGKVDPKKVDWSKTSDLDILNDRVTYKRG